MRILQIIDSLHPGGAERMAIQIANGLASRIEFTALCCTREEGLLKEKLLNNVSYLFANRQGKVGISGLRCIVNFVKRNRVTHIHAHGTSLYTALFLKISLPYLKLVWHDHYGNAEFLEKRPKRLLKMMAGKIDTVIVVNEQLRKWALKHKLSNSVHYLANFTTVTDTPDNHFQVLPGLKDKRVVCLANLRFQKNQLYLLEVWRDVMVQFPDWNLLLVGKMFGDAYQAIIENMIEVNQLKKSVHLLGARSDGQSILQKSTIGVLSSSSEGLPLALLEYGIAGLPVVVTDVGACRAVVGDLGIVVHPNDKNALTKALLQLMENRELRDNLGTQYKKHITSNYGEQNYLDNLLKVYNTMND